MTEIDIPVALEQIVKGLQSETVNSGRAEFCRIDDYKIALFLNNTQFYNVNGNYNVVGSSNTISIGTNSLDEHQKLLVKRYNELSPVLQVEIIYILGDEKRLNALVTSLSE